MYRLLPEFFSSSILQPILHYFNSVSYWPLCECNEFIMRALSFQLFAVYFSYVLFPLCY